MKRCPFCAEEIQDAAIVCRFCNRELSNTTPIAVAAPLTSRTSVAASASKPKASWKALYWTLGVIAAFWLVALALGLSRTTTSRSGSTSADRTTPPASAPARVPWVARGSGDTVFDMQRSVRRVRITGHYAIGNAQNFAVKIDRRLIVNELLGTASGTDGVDFEGTYATRGGQVEVFGSNGVSWVFEEVR